jgi:hypothetical protein
MDKFKYGLLLSDCTGTALRLFLEGVLLVSVVVLGLGLVNYCYINYVMCVWSTF